MGVIAPRLTADGAGVGAQHRTGDAARVVQPLPQGVSHVERPLLAVGAAEHAAVEEANGHPGSHRRCVGTYGTSRGSGTPSVGIACVETRRQPIEIQISYSFQRRGSYWGGRKYFRSRLHFAARGRTGVFYYGYDEFIDNYRNAATSGN